ncbi:MAG: VWA domain-containing protein [Bacteroidota bacterium]|nr:VWA domain-containing protein [Bacteroidota bacterium]
MNLHFQYIYFFWLLPVIAFFIFLFMSLLRWKKKVKKRIGDPGLVKELLRNFSPRLFTTKFIFLSLAFAFGLAAIANLRKPGESESISRKGIDVVIALDVSKSMLATDLQPNRLERAKQMIIKLIDRMPNDRIGLVFFAGRAYLQMPLTVDHATGKLFIQAAGPDAIPAQGTVISDALQMSNRGFNSKEGRFKSVILISDGEDHDANAMKTAIELAALGVMINTVGIGSAEGSSIIDPETGETKKDETGNIVISKLNESELMMIAEKTNGIYLHLQSTDEAVGSLINQLSQIEGKAYGDTSLMNYETYYWIFAAIMLALLFVELFIPERK